MRRFVICVVVASVGTMWFAVSPASAARTCTGDTFNQTIAGNLIVPNDESVGGKACVLDNTTVTGSVFVQPGGDLEMRDGTHVYGAVSATQPERVSIHTQARGEPTNTIGGNLTIDGSSTDAVESVLCGVEISGKVSVTNVTQPVSLEADGPEAGCDPIGGGTNGPVTVGGNITATGNSAEFEMSHVTARGAVTVSNNTYEPELEGNTISGRLTCSNNTGGVAGGGELNHAAAKTGQCRNI